MSEKTLAFLLVWLGSTLLAVGLPISILLPFASPGEVQMGAVVGTGIVAIVVGVWMWRNTGKVREVIKE